MNAATWASAAARSGFAPYELIEPKPRARWAGGFDDGVNPASLEIAHTVGGDEISVETRRAEFSLVGEDMRRFLVEWMFAEAFHRGQVHEPNVRKWTAEPLELSIVVIGADSPILFKGASIVAERYWAASAPVGSGLVVLIRATGWPTLLTIAPCDDLAMPEMLL